ncbi:MAG: quinolinate synthase NadA [Candidatus Heimdallarchaeota archaeon]|nr:quinolinate synthase NadA [Candidatus Heimdallarchaeota archaeon]
MSSDLINEINSLKKERDAILLVHNYQEPTIQMLGDFIGDSLELAQKANTVDHEIIVFAGAEFMAETAAILNRGKKVLIPSTMAKCPMARMLSAKKVKEYRKSYPDAEVAVYVNTTAETKAEADICITSGNAVKIIKNLENSQVLVGPDRNLAHYIQSEVPEKEIIPIPADGHCYVHQQFTSTDIINLKEKFPKAIVLVHPESEPSVQNMADYICSTSGILSKARRSLSSQFIIATEIGIVDRLRREHPEKEFIPIRNDAICVEQKSITLYNLYLSLLKEQFSVKIPDKIATKAYSSIKRMLDLSI